MTDFTDAYANLLIKQYWGQSNANAEIVAMAASYESIKDVIDSFGTNFDVDTAVGIQLDIIGRLVNFKRITISQSDSDYRFFLKAKIAANNASGFMVSDNQTSIQDVINYLFDGEGIVYDRQNMSLALSVPDTYDATNLVVAESLELLPKPQGVRYASIVSYTVGGTFGFYDDPDALPWDDKFSETYTSGVFAEKVL